MTGTRKAPRRSASASPRKEAAKPAEVTAAARSLQPRKPATVPVPAPAKAMPEVKPAVQEVAELTAADLAVSQEVPETPPAPVAAKAEEPKVTVPPQVEAVIETAEKAVQKGKETMSDVLETTKKYTDEAKERFQTAFAEINEKAKAGVEKSTKAFGEFSEIAKGNVEALVESGKIATKGVEAISQGAAEYGRLTFEKASAAMKSLAAVKSPTEYFQLQSELLSSSFDAFAKESAKASEAMLKLAGEVAQPISTRVSVVSEKVRSFAA